MSGSAGKRTRDALERSWKVSNIFSVIRGSTPLAEKEIAWEGDFQKLLETPYFSGYFSNDFDSLLGRAWPTLKFVNTEGSDLPTLEMRAKGGKTVLLRSKPDDDLRAFMLVANLAALHQINFEERPVLREAYVIHAKSLLQGDFDLSGGDVMPTWGMTSQSGVLQWMHSETLIAAGVDVDNNIQQAINRMKVPKSSAPMAGSPGNSGSSFVVYQYELEPRHEGPSAVVGSI